MIPKEIGGSIATKVFAPNRSNQSILGYNRDTAVVLIDFDISINTIDATNSKAGIGLFVAAFGGGAQTGSELTNNQLSRLKFSVPVVLPVSTNTTKEEV